MRRAPAATPRMRPEVRPRKLTRRSASPSAKVFKMMASVSRAGMKCQRDRLERGIGKVSGQAGRTYRTKLNTTGEEASQCRRERVVEEMQGEGWPKAVVWVRFQNGKTFKYYFQCRRADILGKTLGISCTQSEVWVRVETEPPLDGPGVTPPSWRQAGWPAPLASG